MKTNLAKKFADFLTDLPEKELLKFAQTQDQVDRWLLARDANRATALCFEARFCGKDDPIASWKQQTKSTQLAHRITWLSVDVYESLWGLVQLSFTKIKEAFQERQLCFPFPKAWSLFLEISRSNENNVYTKCLTDSQTINVNNDLKAFKLIRKEIWSKLNEQEMAKLLKLVKSWGYNDWLHIVYCCCEYLSKSDPLIAKKFNEFRSNLAIYADWGEKLYSTSSKGRLDFKIKSQRYVNGELYEGQSTGGTYSKHS